MRLQEALSTFSGQLTGLSISSTPSRLIRLCRESRRSWSTKLGVKAGHKPGSVHASEEGGWLSIWDRRYRRPRAARSNGTGPMASRRSLALLPAGVYRASTSRCCWCALTAPLHPCLCRRTGHRRCVSVALSSRSPALGVTQQAWPSGSPDFPQPMTAARRQRPSIAITSPTFNPHNGL